MADRLGFILVKEGKISQEQLFEALRKQRTSQKPLGQILIESGLLREADILEVISRQHGTSFVHAEELRTLDEKAAELLDRSVAEIYRIVPLRREPERLIAVSYNPENLKHQSEIGYFAGAPVQLVLAFAGVATVIPGGSTSAKSNEVAATVLAVLSIVNVSVAGTPNTAGSGANDLEKVGGGFTRSESEAGPLLPFDDVKSPVVFTKVPAVEATTSTDNVQTLPAPTKPAE